MARMAQHDMGNRIVHVDRKELLKTLTENRAKHVAQYKEAMEGYLENLTAKVDEGIEKAKAQLAKREAEIKAKIKDMSPEDIKKQSDWFTVLDSISVEMKVPKDYSDAYDTAIGMAEFDVRDVLELSMSEVNCFMRNQWDWTNEFEVTNALYSKG